LLPFDGWLKPVVEIELNLRRSKTMTVGEMNAEELAALVSRALEPRFESIDKRFNSMGKRIDGLEQRLVGIDFRVQTLEKGQKSARNAMSVVSGTMNVVEHQLAAFQADATKKLDLIKDQVDGFYMQNGSLQQEYGAMGHPLDELEKKVA